MQRSILTFFYVVFILGCVVFSLPATPETDQEVEIRFAEHFSIDYGDTYKLVTVREPWENADKQFTYLLVQRGTERPEGFPDATVVEIPITSIVTMSTSYIGYMQQLGLLDTLVGCDSFKYIYSPRVREMIEDDKLNQVGSGPNVNVELLYAMNPDIIMTYGLGSKWDTHPKLLEAGLKVVLNAEHTEVNPLARSEWIKFFAAFYNKEKEASRYFDRLVEDYRDMAEEAQQVEDKPTVLNNAPYQGTWWIAGGESFAAQFIEDAGGDYLWSDSSSEGALKLDFEAVYEKAADADIWINPGTWRNLDEGLAKDRRFAEFKAFREGNVYNNNRRMNEHGYSDYWESGVIHPDVILADLIKIFHPHLLPDHELFYYRKLE